LRPLRLYSGPPALYRYSTHPWVSPCGPGLRITSCNSPFRLAFGHSNLLRANLVGCSNSIQSNLSGRTLCVQKFSRNFCRGQITCLLSVFICGFKFSFACICVGPCSGRRINTSYEYPRMPKHSYSDEKYDLNNSDAVCQIEF
jgi:hypothetical protein